MSKATKVWLIIATSLLLIGCIICGGAMAMLNWDFTKLSTTKYDTTLAGREFYRQYCQWQQWKC